MDVSQSQATFGQCTPLFIESKATTTTITSTPLVSANVSDMGVGASSFTLCHDSHPISLLRQDDPDTIFGDDKDESVDFHYSPFHVQAESDDDAPVSKGKLKAITEKMDSLLESCKASPNNVYSQAMIKACIETLT